MTTMTTNTEKDRLLNKTAPKIGAAATTNDSDFLFRVLYWLVVGIQLVSVPTFLIGQTMCVFNYDWTVKMGLQESLRDVGLAMVQVNRAFGACDTIINIPLLLSSVHGLVTNTKRSALICTAASAGVNLYWSVTVVFIFSFMQRNDVPDWTYDPPLEIWAFVWFYAIYGTLLLTFLYHYWDRLVENQQAS